MAKNDLVEIKACANAVEAEQVRVALIQHGVSAFVDGANTHTTLSYVGSALGGVRVLVNSGDESRAIEIVGKLRADADGESSTWFCGQCGETIDGTFEVCWGCGSTREDVERPLPDAGQSDPEPNSQLFASDSNNSVDDAAIPDESPTKPTNSVVLEGKPDEFNEEAEAMVLRAWRASVLGTACFLFSVYSMYLLFEAANAAEKLSPIGERRFNRTLAVNAFIGCLWVLLIYATIWR